ncbi:MAG: hypothetical protein Ct9H300mP23_04480 [Nitrospinota bacterium]|nr:MAG: hypothetical protein Ct9H300mP23_04480 [Nitrospinota bacterium]
MLHLPGYLRGKFGYNEGLAQNLIPKSPVLLANAGYADGKISKSYSFFNTGDVNRLVGEYLQEQWKNI